MLTNIKNRNRAGGFTIIETMIVLAIAGLILLIVFLAVPALQRSAHNTQRKNDVAAIGAAISDYTDNNEGALPDNIDIPGTNVGSNTVPAGNIAFDCTAGGMGSVNSTIAGCNPADTNFEIAALGFYAPAIQAGAGNKATGVTMSNNPDTIVTSSNAVTIVVGYDCNGNTVNSTPNSRSVAILYVTENGSAGSQECLGE